MLRTIFLHRYSLFLEQNRPVNMRNIYTLNSTLHFISLGVLALPLNFTRSSHLLVSPDHLTCSCQLLILPARVICSSHLLVSPDHLTCSCNLLILPARVTCLSHLGVPLAQLTCSSLSDPLEQLLLWMSQRRQPAPFPPQPPTPTSPLPPPPPPW